MVLSVFMIGCNRQKNDLEETTITLEPTKTPEKEEIIEDESIRMVIHPEQTYQILESFGTSGCWWAQYVGGWNNDYKDTGIEVREAIAKLLFDKEEGIGLTCYRYIVVSSKSFFCLLHPIIKTDNTITKRIHLFFLFNLFYRLLLILQIKTLL